MHLDHVRDGRAPAVYQNPQEFFERTFLTQNLRGLASQVVQRLSGAHADSARRADELREPIAKERPGHAVLRLPAQFVRGRPWSRQCRAGCIDSCLASVPASAIQERARADVQKVFSAGNGVERVYFPEKSNQIPDRAALSEEARKLLAWKDIESDSSGLKLDEAQHRLLVENVKRAERDLRETVWRSNKNVFLLAEDNTFRRIGLGLVHSSAAASLVELIVARLKQEDLVSEGVSPNCLTRYWPRR